MTDDADTDALLSRPLFLCGIGGSGMLPLAMILKGIGADVAGSDRGFDQGRDAAKFAWLESQGIMLFPQDGSGIRDPRQILVASAAVEDTVPEVVRAQKLGCTRHSRAELLARLFNAAPERIGIGGTSGKSTVTGMIGWILDQAGRDPTVMNGAVMKNFVSDQAPFASARVGKGDAFVSEVDESDGSIVLYRPSVAVLLNISHDHKSMAELRDLFARFVTGAAKVVINADDDEIAALPLAGTQATRFAIADAGAEIGIAAGSIVHEPAGITATVEDRRTGTRHALRLRVPGMHNLANALAAIAAADATGVAVNASVAALAGFTGLRRRFDIIGTSPGGITVIDDFGHNPEKCAATLRTLKTHEGRVLAFFQPHGFGPLKQMGRELACVFAHELGKDDTVFLCDPVYYGGTVDRSCGSAQVVAAINQQGGCGEYLPDRNACADRIVALARPGDRIVVMGARDDTLGRFAQELLDRCA
ncbi:Mur ligase family protein [Croceicoccus sp. F390]|uniref:Mur ligase family protein n=1 Tax=Croceicoccus esteveae TaxID=3075597 RepID=A0ABU2ZEL3_9SPHN|nr:Mur ligase family protein [Croceicoccus sp. F390]MDT0574801.1 Mur ligase family protein [Croceicoccus sp. F390]